MKKRYLYAALSALLLPGMLGAANLIKDADVNKTPMSPDFSICENPALGTLSVFEENATWNRCLKLELKKYSTLRNGKKGYNVGVLLGGEAKKPGFPVKPSTTYRFAVDIKGTAPRVMFNYREWGKKRYTKRKTSIHVVRPQKEWTRYTGTFTTTADATRAALIIQFWGNNTHPANFTEKIGDYVLIDKISIEEVKSRANIMRQGDPSAAAKIDENAAVAAFVAGSAAKPAVITNFKDMLENKAPRYPTTGKIYTDKNNLCIELQFRGGKPAARCKVDGSNQVWKDDLAEFFFDARPWGGKYMQMLVTAGGARWMNNGVKEIREFKSWSAKTKVLADGWDLSVRIPFKTLGIKSANGALIRFNIGREHHVADNHPRIDFARGNRLAGHSLKDNSTIAYCNGRYSDKELWAYLFIGSMDQWFNKELKKVTTPELSAKAKNIDRSNPGQAIGILKQYIELDRLAKLSKEKFIVSVIPTSTDPAIPFLPDELSNPQTAVTVKAAVNEQTAVALALGNMTNRMEEYQVRLIRGWELAMPFNEFRVPMPGLKTADGTVLDRKNYTIRRGVAYRDSNAQNAGMRYDILAELNEASVVPVPAKEAGLIWLQFDCRNLKPGIYKGELLVTALTGGRFQKFRHQRNRAGYDVFDDSKKISVTLEVMPFELREPSRFPLNSFRTTYNDYQTKFMQDYDCTMYMISPWYFDCQFNDDGTIKSKKPRNILPGHIQYVAKNFKSYPGLRKAFVGYSAFDIFKRIHLKNKFKMDQPEFWTAWHEWLKYVDEVMQQNGIPRNEYTVEVFDEPNLRQFPVKDLVKILTEARKAIPDMNLTCTNGERVYYDAAHHLVDNWIFGQHIFNDPNQMKKVSHFRKQPNKQISMYACGTSMRQAPYSYYRLLSWKAAYCGAEYVSLYQLFEQTYALDFRNAPAGGVAYDTGFSMVPSIRLELLRMGMNDIRYLRELEAMAQGDSPDAKAARNFIQQAIRDTIVIYPHVNTKADEMRKKAAEYILKLKNK